MTTHAELASKLLQDAANFFRNVGDQNEPIKEQMHDNANVYDQVSQLLIADPTGELQMDEETGAEAAETTPPEA